MATVL
jgi:sugar phosphate permease